MGKRISNDPEDFGKYQFGSLTKTGNVQTRQFRSWKRAYEHYTNIINTNDWLVAAVIYDNTDMNPSYHRVRAIWQRPLP